MDETAHLIVALARAAPPLIEQARRAKAAGADLVELRVDQIGDFAAVEGFLKVERPLPCILTVRSRSEGGYWDDDDAARVSLIQYLGLFGPDFVDVELETWGRSANLRQKIGLVSERSDGVSGSGRSKGGLILSYHDLNGTPDDARLREKMRELTEAPCQIAKAVFTCRDVTDAVRILAAAREAYVSKPLIALGMGEAGLLTRVLAGKLGLFGAFAALERGAESAPGQPTVAEMLGSYRWREISNSTHIYGVIGWPVSQSLSPALHNLAMREDEIDGVYLPLPVLPTFEAFAAFMDRVTAADWLDASGFSVTIPHKEHALRWLRQRGASVDAAGEQCGAVNTLIRSADGAWSGANTDVPGLLAGLRGSPAIGAESLAGRVVRVLGSGGAARAAVVALRSEGAEVIVYGRSADKAAMLAAELEVGWVPWNERRIGQGEILINCTPVGLVPAVEETPLPRELISAGAIVFDTIYNPAQTRLLREAAARGCVTIGGLEMFRAQAGLQYRCWHGRDLPRSAIV